MLNDKNMKIIKQILNIVYIVYILVLIYFLLFKNGVSIDRFLSRRSINIIPFYTIVHDIANIIDPDIYILESVSSTKNLFGNIILLIPFGCFLGLQNITGRKDAPINSVKDSFCKIAKFCISIEVLQLISGLGVFDIDDILLNVLGGTIGIAFHKLISKLLKKDNRVLWFYIIVIVICSIVFIREVCYILFIQ